MKRFKKIIASLLVLSVIMQGSVVALAEEESNYNEIVQSMIENYDASEEVQEEVVKQDDRFVNEMVLKQEKKKETLEKSFIEAKEKGEKFYSADEILKAKAKDFGISEEDMNKIKQSVMVQKNDFDSLLLAFKELGQENHPLSKKIKQEAALEIPKSQIFIDHSLESQDGKISGGGWPYCLDDNGYGYQNFITSDCYKAIIVALICASDSTLGKMDSDLRYCKAYIRNCSSLIGHSKYWHEHSWWQQIP
ncbi:hypothetical protein [Niallia sp. FSL W8-0635]|uniref:hypothetical protein n=1 Tax=Niallia sp. FSL W8-0635 TaxID=2975337 RepID=UPI0009CC6F32|nr:Uncharacterised protein [Mycobacteroides abscessus subsp. abscessus]HEO8420300.1 hypothetical protein [Yersinia enterocolitica]